MNPVKGARRFNSLPAGGKPPLRDELRSGRINDVGQLAPPGFVADRMPTGGVVIRTSADDLHDPDCLSATGRVRAPPSPIHLLRQQIVFVGLDEQQRLLASYARGLPRGLNGEIRPLTCRFANWRIERSSVRQFEQRFSTHHVVRFSSYELGKWSYGDSNPRPLACHTSPAGS
jgi:hypothetical protein